MTVLTTFPNGGSFKDFRDTFNAMLADIAALKTPAPTQTGYGLLYRSPGTLAGWSSADSTWAAEAKPGILTYGPSAILAQSPGTGTADAGGVRETFQFKDTDGTLYIFYGAGNGTGNETTAGDSGAPWRPQFAKSADGGLTWTKLGDVPGISLNHGFDAGQWAATDNLFIDRRGSTYYLHRLTAQNLGYNRVCYPSYTSDVWQVSGSSLAVALAGGNFTYLRQTVGKGSSGSFDDNDAYSSCIVYSGGTYYLFYGATNTAGEYRLGYSTGSGPAGPFTKVGQVNIPDGIKGQPENPEVYYDANLGKWVMLTNQVNKSLGLTDRNRVFFSDSLTDWSNCTWQDYQFICPLDGATAIGLPRITRNSDNSPALDALGNIPTAYDTDPNPASGYSTHVGRKIKWAVLETSTSCLAITLSGGTGSGYANDFTDDFSTETVGDIGGQNGWTDYSGSNPKPQVAGATGSRYLDMRSNQGPSLVARPGKVYNDRRTLYTTVTSDTASVGDLVGFRSLTQPYLRVDYASYGVYLTYIDGSGNETNITNAGSLANGTNSVQTTVAGYTITATVNGTDVLTYTVTSALHKAVLDNGGFVGFRNGGPGNGTRQVSNYRVQVSGTGASAATSAPNYYTLANDNFVLDLGVMAKTLGGTLRLYYRLGAAGSVNNGYRINLDLTGGGYVAASAEKVVSGTGTSLATAAGGSTVKAVAGRYHRVTVAAQGSTHTVYVDGEAQLSFTDSTYASGSGLALHAVNTSGMDARVRGFTARKSNSVTVAGVTAGQVVTLRGAGGIPLVSVTATGTTATLTASHYPATSIDVAGTQRYAPTGGIWGGDAFN